MRKTLLLALTAAFALNASASPINIYSAFVTDPSCTASNGSIDIDGINGGTPPYTFAWNTGATTAVITGLAAGYYELTVTDDVGATATRNWTLVAGPVDHWNTQEGQSSCVGATGGQVLLREASILGTPPYTYVPAPAFTDSEGNSIFYYPTSPPGTTVSIAVTDGMGCTGILSPSIWGAQVDGGPNMTVSFLQGSCTTGNGGAATIMNVFDGNFWMAPEYYVRDVSDNTVTSGYFAGNSVSVTGLAPGAYYLKRVWDSTYMAYDCDGNPYDRIDFVIPDLGPDCGRVSGKVFIDNDQDCTQDVAEAGVPYCVLGIQPGPQYAITGDDGHYAFDIVNGSYTIATTDPTLVQLCPVNTPVPFTMATNPIVIDFADSSTVPLDLRAKLSAGPMRPGFNGTFYGMVDNRSPQVSGPVTVTLTLDDALVYQDATPVPTAVTGNTLTWGLPAFTPFAHVTIMMNVQVPVGTALGTPLSTMLEVQNTLPDAEPLNDTASVNAAVVGSYDPNEKTARTSTGLSTTQYFLGQDEWIDYTIRFQNTGTDTAFTVTITDTLATELDMARFEQGVASHPFAVTFKSGRVVEWTFDNILLPDSGTNEAASHGLVSFRIRPMQPLAVGTEISNTANIYFDFNEPVITEPSVLVAEFSTGVQGLKREGLLIAPNPVTDLLHVTLPFDAMDQVIVRSADGRVVMVPMRSSAVGLELDVRGLANGIYVLQHQDHTVRFVKQ